MLRASEPRPRWQRLTQRALLVALAASASYVGIVFIQRARQPEPVKPEPRYLPLSPDYFVVPPKSYVRSLGDARALVGKPLWVREGYRWACTPGPETLGPMERLVPTRAFQRNRQVWLEFIRNGKTCAFAISADDSFYIDDIFLVKDPREVYKDWPPEVWKKIEERRVEPGMTETQITFALGFGAVVKELSREGDANRAMDYAGGDRHVRVTYHYGIAKRIDPLP